MKRQGDLLIIKVSSIPQGAQRQKSLILAEGEATGHKHALTAGEVYEKDGQLFFKVTDETKVILTHPEHHPITFTPGEYRVIRQKEYQPGEWRYVED